MASDSMQNSMRHYKNMRDSGVEWIGMVPSDWKLSTIGSVYQARNTKVSDTDYPPLSVTMNGVVPQLATAAKTDAHDARKLVKSGDFVINSRSDRRGSCGISSYTGSVSLINTVLEPREQMNAQYYNWLFNTVQFADEFYKNGHGIVDDLWTTGWQEMKRIIIPMPSLDVQEEIAAFLNKKCAQIDSTISQAKISITEYKAWKSSIVHEAVTKGLNPHVEMKDSGVNWIGQAPKTWEIQRAKHHVVITHGSDPKTEGFIPVYGSGAESFKTCGEYKTGPAVLLGRKGATLHIPHYIEGRYWNVDTAFDVKTDEKLDLKYYYYLAFCFDYKFYISQTTLPGMTQTSYNNMLIPIPPIQEQKEIVAYIDVKCNQVDDLLSEKQALIFDLESYKKALIYEVVTGKRKVV